MSIRICVSVSESTTQKAVAAVRRAAEWADLVEVRADHIRDLDLKRLLEEKPCPLLFTLRGRREGGEYGGEESARLETIVAAAAGGADYVDVEFSSKWETVLAKVPGPRVMLSSHDFRETPPSLPQLVEAMAATQAGVLKIVTQARSLADNLRIMELLRLAARGGLKVCGLAMGPKGVPSRVLGPQWGSWMTFASLPGGRATAEGQIPADILTRRYRVRHISANTRIYGVLGNPLAHSLSPHVHNAAFAARGEDAVFLPLAASDIDDFKVFQNSLPLCGISVTIPFKEPALTVIGDCTEAARLTGAVNTLTKEQGGWRGDNTDVPGFLQPLRRRLSCRGRRAIVLGAGGAARAAAFGLRSEGAEVCLVARNLRRAREVAGGFQAEWAAWNDLRNRKWDLLVNATPVGMYPELDATPVPKECLVGEWVYDLIYNPPETRLLREASERGCKTIPGTEMFLAQAEAQQTAWFGSPPPDNAMKSALDAALSGTQRSD